MITQLKRNGIYVLILKIINGVAQTFMKQGLINSRSSHILEINHLGRLDTNNRKNLCTQPEDYKWSSAIFYETGIDEFGIHTHFRD